jgi:hypothetical protein
MLCGAREAIAKKAIPVLELYTELLCGRTTFAVVTGYALRYVISTMLHANGWL